MEAPDGIVYLATPYSGGTICTQQYRFDSVNVVAAVLMAKGWHIFSPISHTHPIACVGDLPLGWDYWEAYDKAMLKACSMLLVYTQDGWEESKGVQAEITIARKLGLAIAHIAGPNEEVVIVDNARRCTNCSFSSIAYDGVPICGNRSSKYCGASMLTNGPCDDHKFMEGYRK